MLANKVEVALSYAISFDSFLSSLSLHSARVRVRKTTIQRISTRFQIIFSSIFTMNPIDLQQQLADQRRGRYVRVSDVDRRSLIDTYKRGEDFIALAKKLNIKRSTGKKKQKT